MIGFTGWGFLATHLMPTSVTIQLSPEGTEGSMLRNGRGHMPVMSLKSEGSQMNHPDIMACALQHFVEKICKQWIGGSSEPSELGLYSTPSRLSVGQW